MPGKKPAKKKRGFPKAGDPSRRKQLRKPPDDQAPYGYRKDGKPRKRPIRSTHASLARQKRMIEAEQAMKLRLSGMTYVEIARELFPTAKSGKKKVCELIEGHLQKRLDPLREQLVAIEDARLDEVWRALYTAVGNPEANDMIGPKPVLEDFEDHSKYRDKLFKWEENRLRALDLLLKVHDRRCKLHGLHKVDIRKITTYNQNNTNVLNASVTKVVHKDEKVDLSLATDEQLERIIKELQPTIKELPDHDE